MTSRARFQMAAVIVLVMAAHAAATRGIPNTPPAMLVFHGSAALLEWLLALIAPAILAGRRCRWTQYLLLVSIACNGAGWLLYMAYASPFYYDVSMWALTCAQLFCLFFPDRRDADHSRSALVRHRFSFGGGHYSRTEKL